MCICYRRNHKHLVSCNWEKWIYVISKLLAINETESVTARNSPRFVLSDNNTNVRGRPWFERKKPLLVKLK